MWFIIDGATSTGFDSLTGVMLETDYDEKGYDSTLRPSVQVMASTSSNDSGFKDGREELAAVPLITAALTPPTSNKFISNTNTSSSKRKSTFSSAFKVIRKASKEIG